MMSNLLSEHERDQRDLRILRLLDEGHTQEHVSRIEGVSRGQITRLLAQDREEESKGEAS